MSSSSRLAKCRMEKDRLTLRFLETIPRTFEAVATVLESLMVLARKMRCGDRAMADVELALREALVNAVPHGNPQDPNKKVVVGGFCQPDRGLLLVVEDEGAGFDLTFPPQQTGYTAGCDSGRAKIPDAEGSASFEGRPQPYLAPAAADSHVHLASFPGPIDLAEPR